MLVEAHRAVIAKATQIADQFVPNINIRAAEVPETLPDMIGPLERRKGRLCQMFKHGLVRVLQRDDRPKEVNMLGLFGYEVDFNGFAGHSDRHPTTRYSAEWQRQNCHVTSLRATRVCPDRPWSEPDAPLDFGIIVNQSGIVELIESIKSQPKALSDIMIELHATGWLEQGRVQSHTIAERHPIVVGMPDDALVSFAGGV